jgi:hypothetical protein
VVAVCDSYVVRTTVVAATALLAAGLAAPAPAMASECNDAFCTPGIKAGVVLGAPCGDTGFYVFGTTSWGRLVFCGSPRRYEPRYFRSPPMMGVKDLMSSCTGYENSVAQAPDGLFLTCSFADSRAVWVRGNA